MSVIADRLISWPEIPDELDETTREYLKKMTAGLSDHMRKVYDSLITGNLILDSDQGIYLGEIETNGTWRFLRSGNDLVLSRRESGSYAEMGRWSP